MSNLSFLGLGNSEVDRLDGNWPAIRYRQRTLRRVLNFTRYTIDDVINNPYARFQVRGYCRIHREIERRCEESELTFPSGKVLL